MKQVDIPNTAPKVRVTKYIKFKGMDASTDASRIDASRSPYAPNLVSDTGGNPEKRVGWRVLAHAEAPINGLFFISMGSEDWYLVHGGTKLYQWDGDSTLTILREGVADSRSSAFVMGKKLWILTGAEYLVYGDFGSGMEIKPVTEVAYTPTTIISRLPAGGGEAYEGVNLLQPKRTNKFLADGKATTYQLDSTGIDDAPVTVKVNDAEKAEGTDYTVDRATGQVKFSAAPPAPAVEGQDNVFITFAKTIEGYTERIQKCNMSVLYGVGTNDRVFFTGNEEYRATDWHSGWNDPSFVPDLNYASVGTETTRIMGYLRLGEYLAVIKEDNSQDSTIFLRRYELDTETKQTTVGDVTAKYSIVNATFPLKQGVTGVGAISKYCFANLMDEPLFFSRTGVYGVTSSTVTGERSVQNRSYFVDALLTKEPGLQNAVATEWNGYYVLCVNDHCYVLDGKQNKSYKAQSNGDYVYECYYWEDIPARVFLERQGTLFFGAEDGRICRFNNDETSSKKYSDRNSDEDVMPIKAMWSTKADDDGDFMLRKTIVKKGCGVMVKPYARSSATIAIQTEKDFGRVVRRSTVDVFDFNDLDFTRFSFNTNDGPQVIPLNTKVKKYITAQIIIKNEELNEGFGIYGIIKRFTVGNFVK